MTSIVNVVIPLKNRAKHIKALLRNIDNILTSTNEKDVIVWIGDFESTDINIKKYITQFNFPIKIVTLTGKFVIGKALQVTATKIPKNNLNQIVYFCDADSVFPDCIFQRIREHTIHNKQFYAPMVSREKENGELSYSDLYPHGGKGNLGVYLDDFLKSGGWSIGYHAHRPNQLHNDPMLRTKWGQHDEHIYSLLLKTLTVYRTAERDQWIRWHIPQLGWTH